MSYFALQNVLYGMKSSGDDGFEGLIAVLLEKLLTDRFYVARSGSQPADAVSRAGVAIQTKRYKDTRFNETEFEGEFSRVCREVEGLDVYVFASTREHAQLEVLARRLEEKEGVDIFLLSLVGKESPLAALCVTFWQSVRRFFPTSKLPARLKVWAAREAARPEIVQSVNRLRADFQQLVHTSENTRRRLGQFHRQRFGLDSATPRPTRFPIELPRSIVRPGAMQVLDTWWRDPSKPAAVLTAEEGMGKSWVAAAFAHQVATETSAIVVWLDSADWTGCRRLREVVEEGLRAAGIDEDRLVVRLSRKALVQWRHRLLLVLDGVNERGAQQTAHYLLRELAASSPPAARLLFTTRPAAWAPDERAFWENARTVRLDRFTEDEFRTALQSLRPPVERTEVPDSLADIARIPRYFQRALKLRERFRSFANVSKETVLWADLLQKIADNDPQIAGTLRWTSQHDASDALRALADSARQLRDADPEDRGQRILLQVFGDKYHDIRRDLAEHRIVLHPTGDQPQPNLAHVRLGFALLISRLLRRGGDLDVEALADAVRRELEPLSSQDDITEAIFVALQLSVLVPPASTAALNGRQRAALLLAWSTAHNARVELARLEFWMREDEAAYLDFLEAVFIQPVSGPWMHDLLEPVCLAWRDHPDPSSSLADRLRRWLKLVWSGPCPVPVDQHMGADLAWPGARSKHQLTLSRVALRVLSEALASPGFLPDLVFAWLSGRFCLEERSTPARDGQPRQEFVVHCKDLGRNLGTYFRWRCTEANKDALQTFQRAHRDNAAVAAACDEILAAFDRSAPFPTFDPAAQLQAGASFFADTGERSESQFHDGAHLAVRDDLPALATADADRLAQIMEAAFASPQLHSGRDYTAANHEADQFLAWFAREHPQRLLELGSRFRLVALGRGEQLGALDFANSLPYSPALVPPRVLLDEAKQAAVRLLAAADRDARWIFKDFHVLAVTCFGEPELAEWFEFAAEHLTLRKEYHVYPLPLLMPLLCPPPVANDAMHRAAEWAIRDKATSATEPESKFEFWADIASRNADPNREVGLRVAHCLESCPRGNWQRFHLLVAYFRSLPEDALQDAFASGKILRHLDLEGWRALRATQRSSLPWTKLPQDFEAALDHVGINVAGAVFRLAGQTTALQRWGERLFKEAAELLGQPVPARRFWGGTVHLTDRQGHVVGSTSNREDAPTPEARSGLRADSNSPRTGFWPRDQEWEKREATTNQAIQLWLEDIHRLEALPAGVLYQFQSAGALADFRELDPARFRELATAFLQAVLATPNPAYHLGSFAHFVAGALVPLDPGFALDAARQLRAEPFRHEVLNEYGVAIGEATVWRTTGDGNPACAEHCRAALVQAGNDAQLMQSAVTAQAEGANEWLQAFCDEQLAQPLARDRCLAVSLLAWATALSSQNRLTRLERNDPSGWVRAHAAWAAQVARRETAARGGYRRALAARTAAEAQIRLEILRPALTWTAGWWRREVEAELRGEENAPVGVRAAVALFWHGIDSTKRNAPDINGRKLAEHLRGEKIADLRAPGLRLLADG